MCLCKEKVPVATCVERMCRDPCVCKALLSVGRALGVYVGLFLSVYRAFSSLYRALLSVYLR